MYSSNFKFLLFVFKIVEVNIGEDRDREEEPKKFTSSRKSLVLSTVTENSDEGSDVSSSSVDTISVVS